MQAVTALEAALTHGMTAADDMNGVIDLLTRVAKNNQSPAVADFLLSVAQRLKKARGNIRETNAILDDALYTIQRTGPDFEIRTRKKS